MVYKLDELRGRVFTLAEVADMLGIKPDAVRRRVREGQLPVRRPPGSEMLVMGDELAAYLMGETAPSSPKARKSRPKPERVEAQAAALPFNDEPQATPPPTPAPPPPPPAAVVPTRAARLAAALPKGDAADEAYKLPMDANQRLSDFMRERGLSQKDVAEATGLRSDKVSRLVNGKRSITRDTLAALREGYGDALAAFLKGDGPMPKG